MAEEALALLALEGTGCVLDIGCGDGKITAQIAARLPRGSVLGIDPSHDMIAFASRHFGPPVRPHLRFEVADVSTCLTGAPSIWSSPSTRCMGCPNRRRRCARFAPP